MFTGLDALSSYPDFPAIFHPLVTSDMHEYSPHQGIFSDVSSRYRGVNIMIFLLPLSTDA